MQSCTKDAERPTRADHNASRALHWHLVPSAGIDSATEFATIIGGGVLTAEKGSPVSGDDRLSPTRTRNARLFQRRKHPCLQPHEANNPIGYLQYCRTERSVTVGQDHGYSFSVAPRRRGSLESDSHNGQFKIAYSICNTRSMICLCQLSAELLTTERPEPLNQGSTAISPKRLQGAHSVVDS